MSSTSQIKGNRDGFGKAMVEIAKKDPQMVVLCGDLSDSLKLTEFKKLFPDRYVECGVAEQNMMGVASGLALQGKNPWVVSYAVFNPERNLDQLRTAVYSELNIKVVGGHAGLATGRYGSTHQALEDLAIICSLPYMTAIVPSDYQEALTLSQQLHKIKGPGYLRLSRLAKPNVYEIAINNNIKIYEKELKIGHAQILNQGNDLTIIANGLMLQTAIEATALLKNMGLSVELLNLHTVKPLDETVIINSVKKTKALLVAQEHQLNSGLNSSIAQLIVNNFGTKLNQAIACEFMGVDETFGESGSEEELYQKHSLDKLAFLRKAKLVLAKKKSLA